MFPGPMFADRFPLLAAAVLAAVCHAPVTAQTASVTYYGATKCSGSPSFSITGLPRLGAGIRIVTAGSVRYPGGGSQNTLLIGLSDQNMGGLKLPIDISTLSFQWCGLLLNSNEVWLPVTTPAPSVSIPFTVPKNPAILGVSVYIQALRKRTGLAPGVEFFLSRGARLTIGR